MFEEGWGEFFGTSAESMAVLGGWCLGGGEEGRAIGRAIGAECLAGDELAVDFKLGYTLFGSSNAWGRKK